MFIKGLAIRLKIALSERRRQHFASRPWRRVRVRAAASEVHACHLHGRNLGSKIASSSRPPEDTRWQRHVGMTLVAAKRGYVLCPSDEGFSLAIDDGTGDEVMQGENPRYWATLKAIRAWLVARPLPSAPARRRRQSARLADSSTSYRDPVSSVRNKPRKIFA